MLEYGLASSAVSVGWSGYFQSLAAGFGLHLPAAITAAPGSMPGVSTLINLPAVVIMLLITWVLSYGVRESARINNVMVAIKIGVALLFIAVGVLHVKPANWTPFMPFGTGGMFNAAALAFFAFIGFDAVTSAAEEVRNPGRDLPIGIIGSLIVCTLLYVTVAAIMTGIVPFAQFAGVDHPVSLALPFAGQNWIAGSVDLGAILGMTTVILVTTYGQTRITYAMSRDGLLPPMLSSLHPKHRTPFAGTWIIGVVFAVIAGFVPLGVLAELINIGTLSAFALVSVAVLVLRRTRADLPRAFRVPGAPVVPLISAGLCLFLMAHLQSTTWIAFAVWLVIGMVIYFTYARRNALLHKHGDVPHTSS